MGFMLKFGDSFQREPRTGHANAHIHEVRQQGRWMRNTRYLESPNAHITSAVLTFFLGIAAAQMWINTRFNHTSYDMTPTGSIAAKNDAHGPGTHACGE